MTTLDDLLRLSETMEPEKLEMLLQYAHELTKASADTSAPVPSSVENTSQPRKRTNNLLENPSCIYCGSGAVKKDGIQHNKQRYRCKTCGRTFVATSNSVMRGSHFDRDTWKEVIEDTFKGFSIEFTADNLGLSHPTVFYMRHKILLALEQLEKENPTMLKNVQEFDETYVLESMKGKKFDEDATREPRKRGEKAQKRGLSNEQVCIMTGVERKGPSVFATSVNRATPTKAEIKEAFAQHIEDGAIIFTDGAKSYSVLEDAYECVVHGMSVEEMKKSKTANLNNVNSFHSFIKSRYRDYKGVASKYINRYSTLFAQGFRDRDETVRLVCERLLALDENDVSNKISELSSKDLWDK